MKEILAPHRQEILEAASRRKATRLRVFGSVARSAAGQESDVDFLVEFAPSASALDQIGLIQDLETLLHRKVDLTEEAGLHWLIRPQAILEAVPL